MNSKLRTLALVALVAVGSFAGAAAAASNASISASPATPGETSTHTATLTTGNDTTGSLNGFQVDYSGSGIDVSNVGTGDVATIGIDEGDDAEGTTVDQDVSDDLSAVSSSNNGETVTFKFGGSYELSAGDEVVVVFENVQNADAGEYEVTLDINPQSSGGSGTAMLTLEDDSLLSTATPTATATDEPMDESTETATESSDDSTDTSDDSDSTDSSDSDEQAVEDTESTDASGPGFGVALTVLALLGAAFVATRRDN
jgi:PGF-CTERM protein